MQEVIIVTHWTTCIMRVHGQRSRDGLLELRADVNAIWVATAATSLERISLSSV